MERKRVKYQEEDEEHSSDLRLAEGLTFSKKT